MSLLMEALRKAEESKKQVADTGMRPEPEEGAARPESSDLGSDELGMVGADENGKQELTLDLADEPEAPAVVEVEAADVVVVAETLPAFSEPETDVEPEAVLPPVTPEVVQAPESASVAPAAVSTEPAADAPVKRAPVFSVEGSKRTARTVFTAKKEYQRRSRNRRLLVIGITAGLLIAVMAGFFFLVYRSTLSSDTVSVAVVGNKTAAPGTGKEAQPVPVPEEVPAISSVSLGQEISARSPGQEIQGAAQSPPGIPSTSPGLKEESLGAGATDASLPLAGASRPVATVPSSVSATKETGKPVFPLTDQDMGAFSGHDAEAQGQSRVARPMGGEQETSLSWPSDMKMEPVKAAPAAIVIKHRTARPQAGPLITAAYEAYQKGDFIQARINYQQVLRAEPKNRSALLALAAIATQGQEVALARDLYLRLLDQDPADPLARAGLLAIAPAGDPARQESELKLLLEQHPKSAPLFFSLGNLYAAGQRWSEAQQAYFNALQAARSDVAAGSPSLTGESSPVRVHPDYPFNLAVSLEHLGKVKPAINFYKEALRFAAGQPAGFDPEVLRTRLQVLEQGVTP